MKGKLPAQTYFDLDAKRVDLEVLRQRLKLRHLEVKNTFNKNYPHVDRFFKEKGQDLGKIREHSSRILGAGAIAGMLFLGSPSEDTKLLPSPQEIISGKDSENSSQALMVDTFKSVLPGRPRPLLREEEKFLEQILSNITGIPAKASLEGEHLNTTYGFIGAEQHLIRYPGDSLALHSEDEKILKSGIAPGKGAWGYFAQSGEKLSPDLVETEKWYAVVQTLYLPDWNKRFVYLRDWYKHRKVLIVNTDNGKSVVAAIADSGPAAWTGKHFGGSPEVMDYLGGQKYKKGPVLVFFVDDPENKISLGPVEYNNIQIAGILKN